MSLKRRILVTLMRALFRLLTRWEVRGRENLPPARPLIIAFNHLGHLDGPLVIATMPWEIEGIVLADLMRVPVIGWLLRLYGTILVHRDEFDRAVLKAALRVLDTGGVIALAPEARQSPTGALVEARAGAAYLALLSGAPVLPVGLTGTETMYTELRRLRRPRLTVTIGAPFSLRGPMAKGAERKAQLARERDEIMQRIAALLPPEYRGVYG